MNKYILGIDTSNYTTSAAVTSADGRIICDSRRLLTVKEGNRGLRQQDALFQHVNNMPEVLGRVFELVDGNDIGAVCVSTRPRNVEGSYMPCFNAGISQARSIGCALGIPVFETSHQEGHLMAAMHGIHELKDESFIFCHLSGGTCEILDYDMDSLKIIGGSLDISFGQLLDRTGVALGYGFPCGRMLDEIATSTSGETSRLSTIKCREGKFNLSGIETQIMREIEKGENSPEFVREIFIKVTRCLAEAVTSLCTITGRDKVLLAGGVSSSMFLREHISEYAGDIDIYFGKKELCSDNAVGVSLIGGRKWQQNL